MPDIQRGESFDIPPYTFIMTCWSCPEQYDVYADGVRVIYVRLRHGRLTAERVLEPDNPLDYGELIYSHEWVGDPHKGDFDSDAERMEHLQLILDEFATLR